MAMQEKDYAEALAIKLALFALSKRLEALIEKAEGEDHRALSRSLDRVDNAEAHLYRFT
jgi:hypothetical protein